MALRLGEEREDEGAHSVQVAPERVALQLVAEKRVHDVENQSLRFLAPIPVEEKELLDSWLDERKRLWVSGQPGAEESEEGGERRALTLAQ